MMKSVFLVVGILTIAGCTSTKEREARCKCFTSSGAPSGRCDFQPLPGQTAVFSFSATSPDAATNAQTRAMAEGIKEELCGDQAH